VLNELVGVEVVLCIESKHSWKIVESGCTEADNFALTMDHLSSINSPPGEEKSLQCLKSLSTLALLDHTSRHEIASDRPGSAFVSKLELNFQAYEVLPSPS
jgi:hypothetical protein